MKTRGEKFKELLFIKGMPGATLARKLGVSRQQVSWWTCGRSTPKIWQLRAIAQALDTDIETIVSCFEDEQ